MTVDIMPAVIKAGSTVMVNFLINVAHPHVDWPIANY